MKIYFVQIKEMYLLLYLFIIRQVAYFVINIQIMSKYIKFNTYTLEKVGSTVVQRLVLLPRSKKVAGLIPTRGLPVWSLHAFPVPAMNWQRVQSVPTFTLRQLG